MDFLVNITEEEKKKLKNYQEKVINLINKNMLDINLMNVLIGAVLSMIVGSLWYGPIFGKKWMEVIGVDPNSMNNPETKKAMQKQAMPLYIVQFLLAIFQVWVLAHYIANWEELSGVANSLWIFAGFVVPTLAGSSMWTNDSTKIKWQRFLIQFGYQLIVFIIFGLILK
jgi:hypothetical protein